MIEQFYNNKLDIKYDEILSIIRNDIEAYIIKCNIKSIIIGVSGGLDSGVNCAILKPICDKLHIPMIGRYIHIDSNTNDEKERAEKIGIEFCSDFKICDLTNLYEQSLVSCEESNQDINEISTKIKRGNIKARLRMIYLYNLAYENNGIVIDNDNLTERLLGFWTLNGDVGDLTPLASLLKSEVYMLANELLKSFGGNKFIALQQVVSCKPTDGLGITNSDFEQLGCKSYEEVDDILLSYLHKDKYDDVFSNYLYPTYGKECVDNIISRYEKSNFKRKHPYRIVIDLNK